MNGVLALRGVRVQNANAVAGLTYGFPAVSGCLGFVEALDRRLRAGSSVAPLFDGCAIVCHSHRTLTDSHYGVHQFALARRPVQVDGRTAPFVEEGRMHMSVTLLVLVTGSIEAFFDETGIEAGAPGAPDEVRFAALVADTAPVLRFAGGTILDIRRVEYVPVSDELKDRRKDERRLLLRSLPGFALVDRSDLLPRHLDACRQCHPETSPVEAWMDFGALRYRAAAPDEAGKCEWERVPLPETGWFVPLPTGYRAIAPLQEPGSVSGARDPGVPFAPVESVYGVGQWLSPHRAPTLESLVWRYGHDGGTRYSFVNRYITHSAVQEEDA